MVACKKRFVSNVGHALKTISKDGSLMLNIWRMCHNRGDTLPDIWSSEFWAILILNQAIHEVPRGDEHGQLQREDVDTRSDWLFAPHDARPMTESSICNFRV